MHATKIRCDGKSLNFLRTKQGQTRPESSSDLTTVTTAHAAVRTARCACLSVGLVTDTGFQAKRNGNLLASSCASAFVLGNIRPLWADFSLKTYHRGLRPSIYYTPSILDVLSHIIFLD